MKLRLLGNKVTAGATPTPLRLTDCGLPGASSLMITAPRRTSVVVGVKVTVIEQTAPTATLAGDRGQVFVWAKSPVAAMLEIVKGAPPLFASVTVCAALLVPTNWLPNVRLAGDKLTDEATPMPLRPTV